MCRKLRGFEWRYDLFARRHRGQPRGTAELDGEVPRAATGTAERRGAQTRLHSGPGRPDRRTSNEILRGLFRKGSGIMSGWVESRSHPDAKPGTRGVYAHRITARLPLHLSRYYFRVGVTLGRSALPPYLPPQRSRRLAPSDSVSWPSPPARDLPFASSNIASGRGLAGLAGRGLGAPLGPRSSALRALPPHRAALAALAAAPPPENGNLHESHTIAPSPSLPAPRGQAACKAGRGGAGWS